MRFFLSVLMALSLVALTPRSNAEFEASAGCHVPTNAATIIRHDVRQRDHKDLDQVLRIPGLGCAETLRTIDWLNHLQQSGAPAGEIVAVEGRLKHLLLSVMKDWARPLPRPPYYRHPLADPQQQLRDLIEYYVYWSLGALLAVGLCFTAVDVLRNCHLPATYELQLDLSKRLIDEATFRSEMRALRYRLPKDILIRFGTGFIPSVLVRWYSWLRVP